MPVVSCDKGVGLAALHFKPRCFLTPHSFKKHRGQPSRPLLKPKPRPNCQQKPPRTTFAASAETKTKPSPILSTMWEWLPDTLKCRPPPSHYYRHVFYILCADRSTESLFIPRKHRGTGRICLVAERGARSMALVPTRIGRTWTRLSARSCTLTRMMKMTTTMTSRRDAATGK